MKYKDKVNVIGTQNPDCLFLYGYEKALIGYEYTDMDNCRSVYDYEKCIHILMKRDGMDRSMAEEYFDYNTLSSADKSEHYRTPIIIKQFKRINNS